MYFTLLWNYQADYQSVQQQTVDAAGTLANCARTWQTQASNWRTGVGVAVHDTLTSFYYTTMPTLHTKRPQTRRRNHRAAGVHAATLLLQGQRDGVAFSLSRRTRRPCHATAAARATGVYMILSRLPEAPPRETGFVICASHHRPKAFIFQKGERGLTNVYTHVCVCATSLTSLTAHDNGKMMKYIHHYHYHLYMWYVETHVVKVLPKPSSTTRLKPVCRNRRVNISFWFWVNEAWPHFRS